MALDIEIRQGDTRPIVQAQLLQEPKKPLDLDVASAVRFIVKTPNNSVFLDKAATITNGSEGRVEYHWGSGDTDTPGDFRAHFEVTFSDGTVATVPNTSAKKMRVYPDN